MSASSVDVNRPVENPALAGFLAEWKKAPAENNSELINSILRETALNAHFLAVIHVDENSIQHNPDGTAVFQKDSVISFVTVSSPEGKVYFPVYTDWKALKTREEYREADVQTLIVSFDDLCALAEKEQNGVIINPETEGFVLSWDMLAHMKQVKELQTSGRTEVTVTKDTMVKLGDPQECPEEMAQAVAAYARSNKSIRRIWLKLMVNGNEKSWLFTVDFKGDKQAVFDGIASAATPHLEKGMYIDMVPYDSDFGRKAARGKPMYQKKFSLFGK